MCKLTIILTVTRVFICKQCNIPRAIKSYLMPWPGPQVICSIHKSFVPGPIETQSSPVLIEVLKIATFLDNWTWMPSVFGLFPAALTLTPLMRTSWQPFITMWNIWLFNDISPLMLMFLEFVKLRLCVSMVTKISKFRKLQNTKRQQI